MPLVILAGLILQSKPSFDFTVAPGTGLTITANGVPIIVGSTIQYYEDGWVRGYFGTTNSSQKIDRIDGDTVKVSYSGFNGIGFGSIFYHRVGNHLKVHYDLNWSGNEPAEVELTGGYISAPALQSGTLKVDGIPSRSLARQGYSGGGDMERRKYSQEATQYQFDAPLTKLGIQTSLPTTLFDARGYDQDYAQGKNIWWLGSLKLDVSKTKPVSFDIDFEVNPSPIQPDRDERIELKPSRNDHLIEPIGHPGIQVPRPTVSQLDPKAALEWTGVAQWPAGHVRFWEKEFLQTLSKQFQVRQPAPQAIPVRVDGGVSKLGLHPGGFQISITDHSISVLGEEDEGLRNGLRRLAQLAFAKDGKIYLPIGYIRDSPKLLWRGAHLFVGPKSSEFQKRLWERVLLPLGFNKVVLQCERTQWDAMPNLKGLGGFMSKPELSKLFSFYKSQGVEPVPLIQSLGHMEWFFEGGGNLDLAVNSKEPYTIDPRSSIAKDKLKAIWSEACDLLQPSMVHFGCDEVDMVGFPNDHSQLTTDLWSLQMPVLKEIADQHHAKMMLWGDEGLGPKQAIDATNGDTVEQAQKRRNAIPKGAWIADWHYQPNPKPEPFLSSLQLWKKEGYVPIASTWYQPDNIRSFNLAADVEKTGSLQTTWCGYFSEESNIDEAFEQFSAMVLAGEYSWSSRFDQVEKLGYDPGAVFRALYFGTPRPTSICSGVQFWKGSPSSELLVKDTHYTIGEPILVRSLITSPDAPTHLQLDLNGIGNHLCLALNTAVRVQRGADVARMTLHFADGKSQVMTLKYGYQVSSAEDKVECSRADRVEQYSFIEMALANQSKVTRIDFQALDPAAGLRVYGISIW